MEAVKTLEIVTEVTSPEQGEVTSLSHPTLFDNDQFQQRVAVVMEAIKDPEKERRCVAEIHTYLSLFDEGFRQMGQEIAMGGGPFALMKKMFGMGRG
jgi:hypothetical protein